MNKENRKKVRQNNVEDLAFKKQVDDYFNGTLNRNEPALVIKTPIVLGLAGANEELDIVMNYNTFNKCTKLRDEYRHGHGLTKTLLEQLPEQLRNPVMIFKNEAKNSLILITDLKDYLNCGIMISIGLKQGVQQHFVNRITSIYVRNNFFNYIDTQIKARNTLAYNKQKANKLVRSVGLQLPSEGTLISYNSSIAYTTANVKYPKQKNMKNISKSVNKIQQGLNGQSKKTEVTPICNYVSEIVSDMRYVSIYKYISDKNGLGAAENNLGCKYIQGNDIKRDFSMAVKHFETAKNKGSDIAVLNLAVCYSFGLGVDRDLSKVFSLWKETADIGNTAALKQLADCYYYGRGIKQDTKEALKYYKAAEKAGDKDSETMIKKLTRKKPTQKQNLSKTADKSRPAQTTKKQPQQQTAKKTNRQRDSSSR
ncbi:MAG: hypothetical protein LIO44_00490 [Eubacterium sp.]|nr:hypothetical protein [Eubacterium sp.]